MAVTTNKQYTQPKSCDNLSDRGHLLQRNAVLPGWPGTPWYQYDGADGAGVFPHLTDHQPEVAGALSGSRAVGRSGGRGGSQRQAFPATWVWDRHRLQIGSVPSQTTGRLPSSCRLQCHSLLPSPVGGVVILQAFSVTWWRDYLSSLPVLLGSLLPSSSSSLLLLPSSAPLSL